MTDDKNGDLLAYQCAAFSYDEDGNLIEPDREEIAGLIRAVRAAVRAAERERIAKLCDERVYRYRSQSTSASRRQAKANECEELARVIRAMKD